MVDKNRSRSAEARKYRGAEVIAADGACDAAGSLKNVRLQSGEVPLLPLGTCTRPTICKCIYRHFDDRRQGLRRESDDALVAVVHQGLERRRGLGRRERDAW